MYASVDEQEFWAEGAQAWFDNANPAQSGRTLGPADVKSKEPALAALLTDVYGDGSWRDIKTTAKDREGAHLRPAAEMEHLQGLESVRGDFPLFRFENSPRIKETGSRGDKIRRHDKLGPGAGATVAFRSAKDDSPVLRRLFGPDPDLGLTKTARTATTATRTGRAGLAACVWLGVRFRRA